jgi:hypothetical protein
MRNNSVHTGLSTRVIVGISVALMLTVSACTQRGDGEPLSLPGLFSTTPSNSGEDGERSRLPTTEPSSATSDEDGSGSNDGADGDANGDSGGGVGSGPGGAPWDPCQIITWDDLPGEMPADEAEAQPEPQSAPADAQYTAACRFRAATNDIAVLWGPSSKATIKPEGKHGEEQTTVAGQPALKIVDLSEALTLVCMVKVDLENGRGVAGVGAFAKTKTPPANDKHPCAVALRLAAAVVKRTP